MIITLKRSRFWLPRLTMRKATEEPKQREERKEDGPIRQFEKMAEFYAETIFRAANR